MEWDKLSFFLCYNTLMKLWNKDVNKVACLALGLLIIQYIVVFLFYWLNQMTQGIIAIGLLVQTIASNGLMIELGQRWLHVEWKDHYAEMNFTLKDILRYLSMLVSCGIVFSLILTYIQLKFNFTVSQSSISFTNDHLYNLYLCISAILVGPVLEEALNRWIILRSLSKYNKQFAIVFSALIFSLMHMNVAQSVPNFFTGLILGAISLKYDSLLLPLCVHISNNAMSMLLMGCQGSILFYPLTILYWALFIYGIIQWYKFCIHHTFQKLEVSYLLRACIQPVVLVFFAVYFFIAIF